MTGNTGALSAPPCVMCLKPASKQCSGCKSFWYCDRECQRKHWRIHKMDCGKTASAQTMTPKTLLDEINVREKEFQIAAEIVRKHRESSEGKSVYVTRCGEMLKEDLEDARELPGIKDQLDNLDNALDDKNQRVSIDTLFAAAEGVSMAKSAQYFEDIKPIKEQLAEMARRDEENSTVTMIKVDGACPEFNHTLPSNNFGEARQNDKNLEKPEAAKEPLSGNFADGPAAGSYGMEEVE
eukprot:CAMPEP_0169368362 /NCGR_PEP_ID=MMETSP1017-20121227/34204_1 /TAXON_ID=342587 /ORGANISM="Karlodinium micrum, Strain CCMP2283" /LENGTH=237 /DNA_ID=CAMNT_0009466549 /DNA_START=50 /DNA_END=760 /DNA_ORIENTATION=-